MNHDSNSGMFRFGNQDIQVLIINDEPWWVANQVCEVLGLKNPRTSIAHLDGDDKGVHTVDTLGGPQTVATVNESGLYSLVLRSRKPEAKEFKRWITRDVLPAIRKTGSYSVQSNMVNLAGVALSDDPIMVMLGAIGNMRMTQIDQERRLSNVEHTLQANAEAALALPRSTTEVRELTQRENIRTKIAILANLTGQNHGDVWKFCYADYNKVEKTNLETRAKNAKCAKLELIERDNKLGILEALIDRRIDRMQRAA